MGDTEKIRCLCEKWHSGELSDRALALSVVLELGGVGDCYTSIDDWKRALDLEMSRPVHHAAPAPSAVPDANGGGFDIAAIDRVADRSRSLESTVLDLAMLVLGVDFERGGELSSHRRADVAARCSVSLGRLAPVE